MTLVSLLGKYDRKLKKYCRKCLRQGISTPAAVWVCDNYPQLSSAFTAAEGYLVRNNAKKLEPLFFLCVDYIKTENRVNERSIVNFFSGKKPDISDCEALPLLLFAAASFVAADENNDEETIVNAVKSAIKLRNINFSDILYDISRAERYLSDDPSGIYEKMDEKTKKMYRRAVKRGAEKEGIDEIQFVKNALLEAQKSVGEKAHIGFYLPLYKDYSLKGKVFIASEWLSAIISAFVLSVLLTDSILPGFLLLLPFYSVAKVIGERISPFLFPVREFPALKTECIDSCDTLIAVSSLLPSASDSEKLFSHLSSIYSSEAKKGVCVMLLLDMKNSDIPERAGDEADIAAVKRLIDALNKKHGGGFCVAVRERVYSPTENEYTGFERKRGAVNTLMRYLRDKNTESFLCVYGDTDNLGKMKYVLALDSDTGLSFEALSKLVAVALHPLNKPVYSESEKRIVSGYGIISPVMETSIASSEKTVFSGLFTEGGTPSYSPCINERYLDMFGTGIFSGKGLIDIDAFNAAVTDKFENNRILSHDILEGAVLRTALCSNCVLNDSFPSNVSSFYSRLHRWIRGDVQNLRYIFRKTGDPVDSPAIPLLGKYQLFDNVRREITPIFSLGLLIFSCFSPFYSELLFLSAAFLSAAAEEIVRLAEITAKGGFRVFFDLYMSSQSALSVKSVLRFVLNLAFLPKAAFVSADALVRAGYRSFISGKKLLQWTTAGDSERSRQKNIAGSAVFPLVISIVLFLYGSSFHRLWALIVLLFIPFALSDGIRKRYGRDKLLSETEKQMIHSFAAASWRFFADNVTAFENHLPPDNIQETPVYSKARRTSPTNIGLYLVSILACCDMAIITPDEALKRIKNTLQSVTRLPKYKGLLYNWYDTVSMKPLEPCFVSTVDCGNFAVCLTALREGLKEFSSLSDECSVLIEETEKLLEEGDISVLYDKNRELFRIGLSAENGEMSSSYYDYYMSEARMTSYYECARRKIPSSHWNMLDRSVRRNGSFVSTVSWTGTMFEYFMPALFFPVVRGSFEYEALKNALYVQKKRAIKEGIPYGISESCFFSVDPSLNYRYKAHGVKELAMKRDADDESVISPYSTFLTLCFDKKSAMKNLARLSSLHCEGVYGFYEAVDFTKKRVHSEDYELIRCYMSHHVGMSLVAMANALHDNIFVRRFMSDDNMSSAVSLLEEKLPPHPLVVSHLRRIKEQPVKYHDPFRNNTDSLKEKPSVYSYSEGRTSVICDKYGRNHCIYGGFELFRFSERVSGFCVAAEYNGVLYSLFPCEKSEEVSLRKYGMYIKKICKDIEVSAALCVHPYTGAILCPVRIKNNGKETADVKVHYYGEPLLIPLYENDRHPAFSDMFIRTDIAGKGDIAVLRRVGKDSAPAAAFAVISEHISEFCFDREKIMKRSPSSVIVFDADYNFVSCETRGVLPCAAACAQVSVAHGKSDECIFALTPGSDIKSALHGLIKLRSTAIPHVTKCADASYVRDELTFFTAQAMLGNAFFGGNMSECRMLSGEKYTGGIEALWETGISGDIPVLTVFADKNCSLTMLRAFVRLYKNMRNASIICDLVFIFEKGKEYISSEENRLMSILKEYREEDNIGTKGGIHIFFRENLTERAFIAVLAFSSAIYPDRTNDDMTQPPFSPETENKSFLSESQSGFTRDGFLIAEKPCVPWSHTLSNNTFGTLVTDSSPGFTWALNSGLNKLTQWSGDVMGDLRGEYLYLKCENKLYNITEGSRVHFTPYSAEYYSEMQDMSVSVIISVPERGMKKRISVAVKNNGEKKNISVIYCTFPILGEKAPPGNIIEIKKGKNYVTARNPLNSDYCGIMMISCYGSNVESFSDAGMLFGTGKKCAGILQKFVVDKNKSVKTSFCMSFAKSIKSLEKSERIPFAEKKTVKKAEFNTGIPSLDVFASSLLYHQVKDTRLRARCGFYQCSGAWGYRDQLQDAAALIGRDDSYVRQVIFRMACAQFPEGDVLHWFHMCYNERLIYKGVRTRCSDDKLWLVYAVGSYVLKTGDISILNKKLPFLKGDSLRDSQSDCYSSFSLSREKASLFSHCLKAIGSALKTGRNSLPIIGSCDWNDSFSAVGEKGQGESVWLAMFLRYIMLLFAKVCDLIEKSEDARVLRQKADEIAHTVDRVCWNGHWYIRAFYDDGAALGDKGNDACEQDLLTAAWSSLADMPDKERVRKALKSAYDNLFDEKNGVVKLFSPPFNETSRFTGYVNFYPEGMRENGGQYTHAAVWFCKALFREGFIEEGKKVLSALLPVEKYRKGLGEKYKTEPYALAGDVYSAEGHEGRGGWSLYTGSAGWLLDLADMLNEDRQ